MKSIIGFVLASLSIIYALAFVASVRLKDGPAWRFYQVALAANCVGTAAAFMLFTTEVPVKGPAGWLYLLARGVACVALSGMAWQVWRRNRSANKGGANQGGGSDAVAQ